MQTRRAQARRDASSLGQHAVSTAAVLDLVLQHTAADYTSVRQLAQLSSVSKQWGEAITRFVNEQCAVLVPGVAYAASASVYGLIEQRAALRWLLTKQQQQLEHHTLNQLLCTPGMPGDVIEAVVETGARINMQQLAAAGTLSSLPDSMPCAECNGAPSLSSAAPANFLPYCRNFSSMDLCTNDHL
jgi:hypothetical protein